MNHLSKRGFSYKAQHCGQMTTSELQYKKIKMTVVIAHVTDFSLQSSSDFHRKHSFFEAQRNFWTVDSAYFQKTQEYDAVREVWLGHKVTKEFSSLSIRWGKKFCSSLCISSCFAHYYLETIISTGKTKHAIKGVCTHPTSCLICLATSIPLTSERDISACHTVENEETSSKGWSRERIRLT